MGKNKTSSIPLAAVDEPAYGSGNHDDQEDDADGCASLVVAGRTAEGIVARAAEGVACAVGVLALRLTAMIEYLLGPLYELFLVGIVLIAYGHPSCSAAGYAYSRASADTA